MNGLSENQNESRLAIILSDITKSFDKKVLFRNFSYSFPKSGIYAITGESGKGKTTLLRIIAGLDKKYSGKASVEGSLSFMFQEYRLFPQLSAIGNILEVAFDSYSEEDEAITRNFLSELNFPEDELLKIPSELSGGMKQRISFARAVLKRSDILILDEPTKELDAELRKKIIEIINAEANHRLVIVVSHNEEDLEELSATKIQL